MTYITLPCVVCGPSFREFTKRMTKRMKKTRKKKSCQIIVPSILLCSYQLPQMPCLWPLPLPLPVCRWYLQEHLHCLFPRAAHLHHRCWVYPRRRLVSYHVLSDASWVLYLYWVVVSIFTYTSRSCWVGSGRRLRWCTSRCSGRILGSAGIAPRPIATLGEPIASYYYKILRKGTLNYRYERNAIVCIRKSE